MPFSLQRARGDVVEAGNQRGDGGLARTRGPDQGHHLARLDPERDVVQYLVVAGPDSSTATDSSEARETSSAPG